jgi:hydroxyacylglutathione hydrolase
MKSVNKSGIELIRNLPILQFITSLIEVSGLLARGHQVVDTRDAKSFSKGHIKGTINVPFNNSFTNWMGWIVEYKEPLYLLVNPSDMEDMLIALRSIGIDQVLGFADAEAIMEQDNTLDSYENIAPLEAKAIMDTEDVEVLDVRNLTEFNEGHMEGAKHIMLGTLKNRLDEVPNKKLIVQCQAGGRSAIAASILKANGFHKLVNMTGGYSQWVEEVK